MVWRVELVQVLAQVLAPVLPAVLASVVPAVLAPVLPQPPPPGYGPGMRRDVCRSTRCTRTGSRPTPGTGPAPGSAGSTASRTRWVSDRRPGRSARCGSRR
uniref:Secreted protein n=1 Tax=Anopheles dirus TaxID=7168 RepID=A0A182NW35_9DIPT